jgi:hypothetical protein
LHRRRVSFVEGRPAASTRAAQEKSGMKKFKARTLAPRAARDGQNQRSRIARQDEAAPRREPPRSRDESGARGRSPAPLRSGAGRPPRGSHADPYRPAQRPARGVTVALDPDVARVFRGETSVNRALRLVIQLLEIAAPRPRTGSERGHVERSGRAGGYQGSAAARGFARKPRFDDSEE